MAEMQDSEQTPDDAPGNPHQEKLDDLTIRLIERDLQNGLPQDEIISNNLSIYDIPKYLDFLDSHGITVDLDELVLRSILITSLP